MGWPLQQLPVVGVACRRAVRRGFGVASGAPYLPAGMCGGHVPQDLKHQLVHCHTLAFGLRFHLLHSAL